MKVEFERAGLLAATQRAKLVMGNAKQLPILGSMLMTAGSGKANYASQSQKRSGGKDNKLEIMSTNLEYSIFQNVQANIIRPGKAVIPIKQLLDILKTNRQEYFIIETQENNHQLCISMDSIQIPIKTFDPEEYPQIKQWATLFVPIKACDLRCIINKALNAIDKNPGETEVFPGMYIQKQKMQLVFYATNGGILVKQELKFDRGNLSDAFGNVFDKPVAVAYNDIKILKNLLNDRSLTKDTINISGCNYHSQTYFIVKTTNATLQIVAQNGVTMPNLDDIIDSNMATPKRVEVEVNRKSLINALKIVKSIKTDKSKPPLFGFTLANQRLVLTCNPAWNSRGNDTHNTIQNIDAVYHDSSFINGISNVFNAILLLRLIENINSDSIELSFGPGVYEYESCIITDGGIDYHGLIMPYKHKRLA